MYTPFIQFTRRIHYLPNDKILDLSKIKAVADYTVYVPQVIMLNLSLKKRKHFWKGKQG